MSPAPPALRRWVILLGALALLGVPACKSKSQDTDPGRPPPAGSARALPAPAGAELIALLDGLAVGDKLGGANVIAIGAIDDRGTIPIVLEQGSAASVIVIAALTETPPPLVSTKSYSVFFERFYDRAQLPDPQVKDAVQQIAARLQKTEKKLPVPAGLKALARPGVPA